MVPRQGQTCRGYCYVGVVKRHPDLVQDPFLHPHRLSSQWMLKQVQHDDL